MVAILAESSYGKTDVRLIRVTRFPDRHELEEWSINVQARGNFDEAYIRGDNHQLLPTDSMRNRIYAMALGHRGETMELFGVKLLRQFFSEHPQVTQLTISFSRAFWEHIEAGGKTHPTAFYKKTGERRIARVSGTRHEVLIEAGIEGLAVLKTSDSRFEGFLHDRFTTLAESGDRILSTEIGAMWSYLSAEIDFDSSWHRARHVLLERFAAHQSASLQQTLHFLGSAVLEQNDTIGEISLSLPNRHCPRVDLSAFGLENDGEVFVPVEAPSGLIEARLKRA